MIDVDKTIKTALNTGKVSIGVEQTLDATKTGRARLLIIASNCPERFREEAQYYAELSNVPWYVYPGSGLDLGVACGKPFGICLMVVRDPGDSDVLRLVEREDVK
ncbi:MAG: 50S ribosomal protein L30e [Candidatus Bathyarchaeia archaeon]